MAILVMSPGPFEQTSIPASLEFPILSLSLINQVVSEEMFENVERRTDGRTDGWTPVLLVFF